MRHLDEGALQAWLDGPRAARGEEERSAIERHLEACPACARRMEALRDDDLRAASLLAPPETDDEIPAFEAVVARARTLDSGDHRRRRWMRAGWAASVCAALGVGWLTNDLIRGGGERLAGTAAPTADQPALQAEEGRMADAADAPAIADAADDDAAEMAERPGVPARPQAADQAGRVAERADAPAAPTAADEPTEVAERSVPLDVPAAEPPAPVVATRVDSAADAARSAVAADPPAAPALERTAPAGPLPFVAAPEAVLADARREREAPREDVAGGPLVVRGRVIDEAGRPLASAQVFEAGVGAGTLTRADGSFTLWLDRAADPVPRVLTLSVELIGYAPERRELAVGLADTASAEFRLSRAALALNEVVISGTTVETATRARDDRAAAPARAAEAVSSGAAIVVPSPESAPERWMSMSRAEAEAAVGFALRTVPDLEIVAVAVGTFEGTPVVRVVQALEGGGSLTLLEARSAVAFDERGLEKVARERAASGGRAPASGEAGTASTVMGDVRIVGAAPLPDDLVRALLDRVR